MPEETKFKRISRLSNEANECDPVKTITFSMWDIPDPEWPDACVRTLVANEQPWNMSEQMPLKVFVHPNTSISLALQSLEYIVDCIKNMEFPDTGEGLAKSWMDGNTTPDQPVKSPDASLVRTCLRCGYNWTPKRGVPPKVCPSCKSRKWNVPKP